MPEICRFYGIIIRMYYEDHNPPHFHAVYGDDEAWININTLAVFFGQSSSRALGLVIEWASMHHDELRHDWDLAKNQQKPEITLVMDRGKIVERGTHDELLALSGLLSPISKEIIHD